MNYNAVCVQYWLHFYEQQEDYGQFSNFLKYYAAHLADSSLLRGLLYERIHAKMLAVKERLGGILHSIHSFIFSVISDT
jgi:predicted NAD-dependent protein-ADP-ribosyltransferase YbiA (DUF1768 family)